jgi:hypothetical protein
MSLTVPTYIGGKKMKKWIMALIAISTMVAAGTPLLARTLPANTPIYITLDQSVSSKTAKTGQILRGSVSQNVVVDGKTAIPRGSRANVAVASVQASGRLSTPAKLYVRLDSVIVNGKTIPARSNLWGQTEKSKAKRDAVGIGGGAAAGAIIGALAGGGKGAAIGTAVGAGAGTVGTAATGKKDIEFPVETKIKFATKTAVTIK